jgi:hypothetical protein
MEPTTTPTRRRLGQLMAIAAALLLVRFAAGHWPKDQTVHYVLGNRAPLVQELRARWAPENGKADDFTREVDFQYAPGQAPRIVRHEPRLPDGDYNVEIDIIASPGKDPQDQGMVRRHVELSGGVTSIDLSSGMSR